MGAVLRAIGALLLLSATTLKRGFAVTTTKVRVGVFVEVTGPSDDDQSWKSVLAAAALATSHFNERDDSIIQDFVDVGNCAPDLDTVLIRVTNCAQGALEDYILQNGLHIVVGGDVCTDDTDADAALASAADAVGLPFLALDSLRPRDVSEGTSERDDEALSMTAPTHASANAIVDMYARLGHTNIVFLYEDGQAGRAWRESLERVTLRSPTLKILSLRIDPDNTETIGVALNAAQRSGLRSIFAAVGADTVSELLQGANQQDMLGPKWVWVFTDMVSLETLQLSGQPLQGSLFVERGGLENSIHQDRREWELLAQWFDNSFPEAIEALVNASGYEVDLALGDAASLAFDAISAIGLSLCAGGGEPAMSGFAQTSFHGTSGLVVFDEYGRRQEASMTLFLRNIAEGDNLGMRQIYLGEWVGETWVFSQNATFANGLQTPPRDGTSILTSSSPNASGYYLGNLQEPSCWVTYSDPQHAKYNQGKAVLLPSCPQGLQMTTTVDGPSTDKAGPSIRANVRLEVGSDACPNEIGNCEAAVIAPETAFASQLPTVQVRACKQSQRHYCSPVLTEDGSTLSDPRSDAVAFTLLSASSSYTAQIDYTLEGDDAVVLVHSQIVTRDGARYSIASVISQPGGTSSSPSLPDAPREDSHAQSDRVICKSFGKTQDCPEGLALEVEFAATPKKDDGATRVKDSPTSLLAGVPRVVRLRVDLGSVTASEWTSLATADLAYCGSGASSCTSENIVELVTMHAVSSPSPSSASDDIFYEGSLFIPTSGDFMVMVSASLADADDAQRITASRTIAVHVMASEGIHLATSQTVLSSKISQHGYHVGNFDESICWKAAVPSGMSYSVLETLKLVSEQEPICPRGIRLEYTRRPKRLTRRSELGAFPVSAEVELGSPEFPVALGDHGEYPLSYIYGADIPHVNFHFCDRAIRFCTPLLRGLGTDVYSTTAPVQFSREDKTSPLRFAFESEALNLTEGMYTVLVHARFYSNEGALQWDVATAFPLEVGDTATDDLSLIPRTLFVVGLGAVGLLLLVTGSLAVWVVRNRAHIVLQIAQGRFLGVFLAGIFFIGINVALHGIEDSPADRADASGGNALADVGCMANIVTYCLGFVLSFSPLLAKLRKTLADYQGQPLRRITVTKRQLVRTCGCFLGLDAVICFIWMLHDPPVFSRKDVVTDAMGFPVKSSGQCTSAHFTTYILLLLAIHGSTATIGALYAFRTINYKTAFSEARYVSIALLAAIVPYAFLVPILFLVESSSSARFALVSVFALVSSFTALFIVFFPKLVFVQGSKTNALRRSLEIDETYEAKVSPVNSPAGSPHHPFPAKRQAAQPQSEQRPKTLGFAVTPVDGLSTLSIRPIASDWIDPDSDDDDQANLEPIYKSAI
ncbi:Gamma-aminobutyric acid type B receptor subunit 2 [Hondaea fermentalgiana]|uniref:Gamma-aminobutyric acid type B receptor subunit 2 n=1 Tax=Hondaea fermentalgiana TaxID=2315210 RepID=A0A2R5GFY3_9STRA|nr:Gamma-aminobutyric acid type B receptor subunit 2 [Hondaea fermentalgiana]|eukprot:GBG26764.1 Gamma-aminobutyric acid type B receptor subunit 2 [Hondaea fermentalgiana]